MFQDTVVDTTGLSGNFDWTLQWAADPVPTVRQPDASDASGAPMASALEDQLGLRLRWTRTSIPVLVIDHVEHLIED